MRKGRSSAAKEASVFFTVRGTFSLKAPSKFGVKFQELKRSWRFGEAFGVSSLVL